ncbi:4-hydroxy-2-oxoglutarate aldolase [Luteitalea pratensis]|uniref:Putative 4-hydroxy-4-methyl-2-oxoglutarate aldolase n=1 Tax=Luteitalea pratensis TaxID=1855912 RepID=A0A143PJP5_LUTPR|nr:RraA family protein [Luteitalea pratensis]AMY08812.1 4-hydroxy-2-oxoglutarate aldolase [Luteitalea pratensis]
MSTRSLTAAVMVALAAVAAPVLTAPSSPQAAATQAPAPAAGTSAAAPPAPTQSPEAVISALRRPENSTGNIADAVEAASGARGWMSPDMKPISAGKIVGRAWTAVMRPVLKSDTRPYPNYLLQVLDEAPAGSVLVYVMQDGLEIAAMGNLMATTAKVRGLEGTVIDGAVRDVTELRAIGHQVFSRRVSPATSVGRMVSVSKQTPVRCADVMVNPGDYIVGDADGVVVVPQGAVADQVIALLKDYDARESKMVPIIQREKSMLKALEIYGRY